MNRFPKVGEWCLAKWEDEVVLFGQVKHIYKSKSETGVKCFDFEDKGFVCRRGQSQRNYPVSGWHLVKAEVLKSGTQEEVANLMLGELL